MSLLHRVSTAFSNVFDNVFTSNSQKAAEPSTGALPGAYEADTTPADVEQPAQPVATELTATAPVTSTVPLPTQVAEPVQLHEFALSAILTAFNFQPQPLQVSEALVPTARDTLLQNSVQHVVKHYLCNKYSADSSVLLPGESGYFCPTYGNMKQRMPVCAKILKHIGYNKSSPFSDLAWTPVKPDRRRWFGVSLAEQLASISLSFTVNVALEQQVSVRLPVFPAVFLACLAKRPCVAMKTTLFRDNIGALDSQDPFLTQYVDAMSYDLVEQDGAHEAELKNADGLFKLWLRSLPDSVIPVEVTAIIKAGLLPHAMDVERNLYPFGSQLPPGVVTELRLVIQLLRAEERALLLAIVYTCIPVAKARGIGPVFIARMLSPCLVRVIKYQSSQDALFGVVLLTFLLVACDAHSDMFDAVPEWVMTEAVDLQRPAQASAETLETKTSDSATLSRNHSVVCGISNSQPTLGSRSSVRTSRASFDAQRCSSGRLQSAKQTTTLKPVVLKQKSKSTARMLLAKAFGKRNKVAAA
ncbi:hypothetical protein RI367_005233 [Sorochytrium milnesiophthora]